MMHRRLLSSNSEFTLKFDLEALLREIPSVREAGFMTRAITRIIQRREFPAENLCLRVNP